MITRFFIIIILFFGCAGESSAADEREFTLDEAEEVLKNALIEEGIAENLKLENIRISSDEGTFSYNGVRRENIDELFTLSKLNVEPSARRFTATLNGEKNLEIRGRFVRLVEVPSLIKRMYRKSIVKTSDIEWIHIPERNLRSGILTEENNIIGKQLTRTINAHKPLSIRDIKEPIIVERGNLVPMIFRTANMELKTLGIAMDDASIGKIIRVKNEKSGSLTKAMINDLGEAIVNYADNFLKKI